MVRYIYSVSMGKPVGKMPHRRPSIPLKISVTTDSKDIGWGVDWIVVATDMDRWWSCCECRNSDSIK